MGKDNTIITGGEIGKELQKYINNIYNNKYEFINTPDEAAANCLYINNHLLKLLYPLKPIIV
jgi:phage tail sheath gpL-like